MYPAISLLGKYPKSTKLYHRGVCLSIFIAALFPIAKNWNWPTCFSTDEWVMEIWYMCVKQYYSALKDEVIKFAAKWMVLECVILSEITQSQKEKKLHVLPRAARSQ